MTILKKKYNYIQKYTHSVEIKPGLNIPVGLYTGSNLNNDHYFIESLWMKSLFPHYGFSMYDNPSGKIISQKRGRIPALFLSNITKNVGSNSVCKITELKSICMDDELPKYRDFSLQMYLGWSDKIIPDIQFVVNSFNQIGSKVDNHTATVLSNLSNDFNGYKCKDTPHEDIKQNRAIYEELRSINIKNKSDYLDFIYLTSGLITSLELSYPTIRNIIKKCGADLIPLSQISFYNENYRQMFSRVFNYPGEKLLNATINHKTFQLCGVLPSIYGHNDGAIFDLASGTVTGKRNALSAFLLFLNSKGILEEKDLDYLV